MSKIDSTFQELCSDILSEGREYENKNRGVKRLQIPSYTLRHSFKDGFPALSIKRLPFRWIVGELIWFLRGDNDVKFLNDNGIPIWNKDAYNWYVKSFKERGMENSDLMMSFEEFEARGWGAVGQNYSRQWRKFNGKTDQIADLVADMRKDIMSSRLKVNAWNPSEIHETALPPCHSEFQVIGIPLNFRERIAIATARFGGARLSTDAEDNKKWLDSMGIPEFGFELHWNQRSVDTLLGLPFNIASYALLAKILEQLTGYVALGIEGTLKCVHFYDNQYEAVGRLMKQLPHKHANCELIISEAIQSVFTSNVSPQMGTSLDYIFGCLNISDFKLENYTSDEAEKVEMLAPKEL